MTEVEESADDAAFRARVRDDLAARLRVRPKDATFSVMGGGTDGNDERTTSGSGVLPLPSTAVEAPV